MDIAVLLLCVKIFFARIFDVTLGTIRQVLIVKNKPVLAACIGFVEIMVWYLVVREALSADASILPAIAYAGGYATGTLLGSRLAHRFIKTQVTAQIITSSQERTIIRALREKGFGLTVLEATGAEQGKARYMLVVELKGSRMKELRRTVDECDPKAFVITHESKQVFNGFIK